MKCNWKGAGVSLSSAQVSATVTSTAAGAGSSGRGGCVSRPGGACDPALLALAMAGVLGPLLAGRRRRRARHPEELATKVSLSDLHVPRAFRGNGRSGEMS